MVYLTPNSPKGDLSFEVHIFESYPIWITILNPIAKQRSPLGELEVGQINTTKLNRNFHPPEQGNSRHGITILHLVLLVQQVIPGKENFNQGVKTITDFAVQYGIIL